MPLHSILLYYDNMIYSIENISYIERVCRRNNNLKFRNENHHAHFMEKNGVINIQK